MFEIWAFRLLFLVFTAIFASKMATRLRLVARAPGELGFGELWRRVRRVLVEVLLQSRTIREKPAVGLAHALVFWGFLGFAVYTAVEFLYGLGVVDLTAQPWFERYRLALVPFAVAVLAGMAFLLVRRVVLRPPALGPGVSGESVLIGVLIVTLMATFLVDGRLVDGVVARVNWWVHALAILVFLILIPDSKHLHLLLSPLAVFFRSAELGTVRKLDFDREEVGFETIGDLERKQVLDALTCVECGRCQMACPAQATGKLLNPKQLLLQSEAALLAGEGHAKLVDVFDPGVLWQCTTCGACENQCPVGIEHLPLIIGARRGLVSNGDAPPYLGAVYNHLERRGNIWGLTYDQRQRFVDSAGLEVFDPSRHEYLVWLGCAGAFEADHQRSLRSLFEILRHYGRSFGVLARERCTGDAAKRTGNEYVFQELASDNVRELRAAGAARVLTACPHCLKTLGSDYREFGFDADVGHAAILVDELTRGVRMDGNEAVTFHDPCYLGRYAGHVDEPRRLIARLGGRVTEPEPSGMRSFCCGAGGGLLFEEQEEGKRISQERLEQLQRTGIGTVVTACPFCSIMLKGAQSSAGAETRFVDLMTFVHDRLGAPVADQAAGEGPPARRPGTDAPPGS